MEAPDRLFPLPPKLRGMACSACAKTQSNWFYAPTPRDFDEGTTPVVCGACFLYEKPWGLENAARVLRLIEQTEEVLGRVFEKDERARLVKVEDCDRFVFAVAMEARMHRTSRRSA